VSDAWWRLVYFPGLFHVHIRGEGLFPMWFSSLPWLHGLIKNVVVKGDLSLSCQGLIFCFGYISLAYGGVV
jgi:hypothetical protein